MYSQTGPEPELTLLVPMNEKKSNGLQKMTSLLSGRVTAVF
ncbi:hypothetical protein [Paenibacillus barcinonensis]|nr:hypothetical protein [Paenibacillus barcinonensis]